MLQKGGYIYRYPHQLGLMLYDCILMLFHDKAVNLLTIVCTFAFLPTVST